IMSRQESNQAKENKRLKIIIFQIYSKSHRRYGAPKIYQELLKKGIKISLKRVQKLMRELDIRSITVKKWRPSSTELLLIQLAYNLKNFAAQRLSQEKYRKELVA
ncbi:hypothetical protein ESZ54_01090, partial [Vagococcus silagei]